MTESYLTKNEDFGSEGRKFPSKTTNFRPIRGQKMAAGGGGGGATIPKVGATATRRFCGATGGYCRNAGRNFFLNVPVICQNCCKTCFILQFCSL
jgi:hypothetical protein